MSNNKLAATFGPRHYGTVHLVLLYDAVCHECGWASPDNPFDTLADAERATDEHARTS